MRPRFLITSFALALAACGSGPPPVPAGPVTGEEKTAVASALTVERQWLASWFRGTPVVIGQRNDGAVTVVVPREFCFERGQSSLKPALVAVLDKVAESLRRVPQAGVPLIAAPDDAAGSSPLALQRAARIQDHLRGRGVPGVRLGKASAATIAAVQLRLEAAPAP
jgi:hypothetical protein